MQNKKIQEILEILQEEVKIVYPGEEASLTVEESETFAGITVTLSVREYHAREFIDQYRISQDPIGSLLLVFSILKKNIKHQMVTNSVTIDPGEYL